MASLVKNKNYGLCDFCKSLISKEKGMWGIWVHENGLKYCSTPIAKPRVAKPTKPDGRKDSDDDNNYDKFDPIDPNFL